MPCYTDTRRMTPAPQSRNVYIETYGCQMNQLDSELLSDRLVAAGFTMVEAVEAAGIVLINTCSVRELAEHKVWSHLGRLGVLKKTTRPGLVIGVLGCMAEREAGVITKRMPYVDLVCGPALLDRLPLLIASAVQNRRAEIAVSGYAHRLESNDVAPPYEEHDALDLARSFAARPTRAQAFVRITRGCDKLCSFCVVPFTRGPEVHRPPAQIVEEVRRLVESGVVEVTLLGQTVNHYAFADGGKCTSFADLLYQVHEAVPALPRLRFVTSYPRDFDDATLDVMAQAPRICRYLHLPAQSGADRILQAMNRGYTVEGYLALLERARRRMPDICFAGDMIAGFPTETEEEHQASLALLRLARYKNCFMFQYSPRSGTVAARRFVDDVPAEVKHRRNLELLELQASINLQHNEARRGHRLEVLVEGQTKIKAHAQGGLVRIGASKKRWADEARLVGRTRGDEIVAFDGPAGLVGQIATVKAVGATALTLLAELE